MKKTSKFNIYEAKTNLSKLVEKAMNGEEVIIAKAGKPLVELKKYQEKTKTDRFGGLEGNVWVADDFNQTSAELLAMFGLKQDKE